MVNVYCDNEECNRQGELMECTEEDSRQEWYMATYECLGCGIKKEHKQTFDQNGFVMSDGLLEVDY